MEALVGYGSIIIGFIILATLCLWLFVKKQVPTWVKALVVPVCIWYGAAMYFAVPNIMGWPTQSDIPDKTILLAFHVVEPSHDDGNGAILIFGYTPFYNGSKISILWRINPKFTFSTQNSKARLFEIPYTRERHNKLLEASKDAKGKGGIMIYRKGKKKKGEKQKSGGGSQFLFDNGDALEVLNPKSLLPKPD